MRPENLKTKIFLDSGDVDETKSIIDLLGFLDGQTTNPTLISKNPAARERLERGNKFTEEEIFRFYYDEVKEISDLMPQGSISVEVYADASTKAAAMLAQAKEMYTWIPNARIKFPTTKEGLLAAQNALRAGMRINMTLCFSEEQAAAVYSATKGAKIGDVYVSPFIGRLDDRGENGMELIADITELYRLGDGHVELLTASVRKLDHLLYALKLGSDIITVPFKVLQEWAERDLLLPDEGYRYPTNNLKPIPYQNLDLNRDWTDYDLHHELTDKGIETFSADWNKLVK